MKSASNSDLCRAVISFDSNMRCIEIMVNTVVDVAYRRFDSNMRCIEMTGLLAVTQNIDRLNSNMRYIEIREGMFEHSYPYSLTVT